MFAIGKCEAARRHDGQAPFRLPSARLNIVQGTRIGPYEIAALIGAGGMGEVYRARDTRLGRDVAIKVIPERLASDPRRRDRFIREARAISKLAHPHICTLYDIGEQDGMEYLVMEYIDGHTLAELTTRGPLPLEQVIRYGSQIADAVGTAHRQGIVHRDLKPGNIMITKSGVKVLDFGLATSLGDAPTAANDETAQRPLTEAGAVVGTLQYMAPEQLRGADADTRSDIFALGTILYEMATGRRAFEGKNRTSVVSSILETQPRPIAEVLPLSPPALDNLVRKCLEKDPDDRLQSASDLGFALREVTQPQRIEPARARRTWIGLAAFAALLVAAVAIAWVVARRRPAANATAAPKTIAVLPFENLGVDKSRQYLLLAIPDEITTILTYSPNLAVRPFSAARRLPGGADPQDAAKKLNAASIVTGHVMDAAGKLSVTLEAIDIANDKLLWRDVFEVASADLITLRGELSQRIRQGLLPRLAGGNAVQERSGPKNSEAYALYLRAAALPSDTEENIEGLRLLEEAVRLDPDYAPAWAALALRSYYSAEYGDGGLAARHRRDEALDRASAIDPNLIEAASQIVTMKTDRGELMEALRLAKRLVAQRPASAESHFDLSYVMRYGGALEESAAECNRAWAIDNKDRRSRSCAETFLFLGDYNRMREFMALDPDSVLSARINFNALMKQERYDEAAAAARAPQMTDLIRAWRNGDQAGVDKGVRELMARSTELDDSEPFYVIAGYISLMGRPAQALELLREAGRRNLCWAPMYDRDRKTFAAVAALPEFAAVYKDAQQCHERFMAELAK